MGLHKSASVWVIPAVIIIVSALIALFDDVGREVLRYDRVWIGQGEVWRFMSGHLAHLSWSHLALNSAGLMLVWYLVGAAFSLREWLIVVSLAVLTIDAAFWLLNPSLHWYVGMSGLLHGLLAAGIAAKFGRFDAESAVLLALLVAKIGWEQFAGPVPGSETTSGGPVVVDAHLWGALGGALAAMLIRIRVRSPTAI